MTDPIDRVRKLIALAGSPNENEARTSAFLACKLIREHGLEVRPARAVPVSPPPPPSPWRPPYEEAADFWEEFAREAQQVRPPRPPKPSAAHVPSDWELRVALGGFVCWVCARTFPAGSTMRWHPNKAARCFDSGCA